MDSAGNTVGCVGNAWAWSNISGGFIAPQTDNTHAWAYPDASVPIGTFGLLTYTSGQAMCNSTVKVVPNITACGFTPPGANLKANDTQYFTLNASVNGTPTIPTDAVYDLIDGLGGNHVNDSVAGTLYQAPADNTSGLLQGAAELNTGSPFVKGAVCFAPVTVGSGIPPNNGTGGDNGKSQWCTIFPSTSAFFPGEVVEVTVWCGKDANETCSYLNWNLQGAQIVPSGTGTYLNITTSSGLTGTITAIVSQDNKESCTFSYTAGNNTCASLS
jgi:hypothetical protein